MIVGTLFFIEFKPNGQRVSVFSTVVIWALIMDNYSRVFIRHCVNKYSSDPLLLSPDNSK